jgi:tRNA(Ile)-lysidine synthase
MAPREGRLVRPLLAITRAETMSYCRERGLGWREDASNADSRFARARVRHRLLPALRELHPAAEANVLRTAALLRDEAAVLDALVAGETAGGTVAIERWDQLDQALRRLVVQRLADDCAGAPVPGAAGRAAEIGELAARGQGALDIGAGVRAVVRGGELRMVPSEGRAQRRRETPRGALS